MIARRINSLSSARFRQIRGARMAMIAAFGNVISANLSRWSALATPVHYTQDLVRIGDRGLPRCGVIHFDRDAQPLGNIGEFHRRGEDHQRDLALALDLEEATFAPC